MSWYWGWALIIIALLFSCGGRDVAGGSTVETDNAVSVQIVLTDGKPASGAVAHIRPVWFVADTGTTSTVASYARDLQADSLGWIRCDSLPIGSYILEVKNQGLGAYVQFERHDSTSMDSLSTVSLKPLGSIEGKVVLPAGAPYAWIQIYGLDRVVQTDSLGAFRVDSLPSAILHIRAVTAQQASVIADALVQVHSDYSWDIGILPAASIYTEDPSLWRYTRSLTVNALISDWMLPAADTTIGFLRLDSTNFDFAQTMADGRDLRLFDNDGNRLVHQRAYWNPELKRAVIRIRLSEMHLISMVEARWGCDGAVDPGSAGLWDGMADSLVQELYTVPVEDFETISLQSDLPAPISPHTWYLIPQDTAVHVIPKEGSVISGIQAAGFGRSGNAFHVNSTAPSYKWALFGLNVDTVPKDFTYMDSVVFWVRGSGNYQFAFERLYDGGGKAVFSDSLDSVWTRKCVRPQDFLPGDSISGNIGWKALRPAVTNMSFFAMGNVDFWLDEIRIYGLNRDDLK